MHRRALDGRKKALGEDCSDTLMRMLWFLSNALDLYVLQISPFQALFRSGSTASAVSVPVSLASINPPPA